jgi:type IV pilus assembly protein PilA
MLLFRGFSLMELMIVLAIIALLTAIGIPAYQTYTTRAKFAEAFSLTAVAQLALAEYQQTTGEWPLDNLQAGLTQPETINGNYIGNVSISQNQITATFKPDAGQGIADKSLILLASLGAAGQIIWECYSSTITPDYLPPNCRRTKKL